MEAHKTDRYLVDVRISQVDKGIVFQCFIACHLHLNIVMHFHFAFDHLGFIVKQRGDVHTVPQDKRIDINDSGKFFIDHSFVVCVRIVCEAWIVIELKRDHDDRQQDTDHQNLATLRHLPFKLRLLSFLICQALESCTQARVIVEELLMDQLFRLLRVSQTKWIDTTPGCLLLGASAEKIGIYLVVLSPQLFNPVLRGYLLLNLSCALNFVRE